MLANKLYKINICCILIWILIYSITKVIFKLYSLAYREWLYRVVVTISITLLLLFLIQSFIKLIISIKNNSGVRKKVTALILIVILSFISINLIKSLFVYWLFEFSKEEYIIERNGEKMIALVSNLTSTNIKYYDYKNVFVRGDNLKGNSNIQNIDEANEILKLLRKNK